MYRNTPDVVDNRQINQSHHNEYVSIVREQAGCGLKSPINKSPHENLRQSFLKRGRMKILKFQTWTNKN